jgi:hypothetical protein
MVISSNGNGRPPTCEGGFGYPLDLTSISRQRPPQPKKGERFLCGPVPWRWIESAMQLPVRSSDVGIILWHIAGLEKDRTVRFRYKIARSAGISRSAIGRGLTHLERAGLIKVERKRGRCPVVTILDTPPTQCEIPHP